MYVDGLELDVPRVVKEKRANKNLSFAPGRYEKIQQAADKWGLSVSMFLERAALWYALDLEADPSKLRPPEDFAA